MKSIDRTAFVTGAGGGMGRACALAFAEAGFVVGLTDANQESLEESDRLVSAVAARCTSAAADITDVDSIRGTFHRLTEELGPPWVVAGVAGLLKGGLAIESPHEVFEDVVAVNLLGAYNTALVAGEIMVEHGSGGRIILWSSISSRHGTPGYAAYTASKAGVDSLTMSLAAEWAEHGITVNAISPGSIDTPMLAYLGEQQRTEAQARIPRGRWGRPEDVANAALFLASEDADWITGVNLAVDGGESAASTADLRAVRDRLSREER